MNQIFATTIASLLNQALQLNPTCLAALNEISDKVIHIILTDTGHSFSLFPDDKGIFILSDYKGEADVTVEIAPLTLLHLVLNSTANLDNTTEVNVSGDRVIAEKILLIIKELDIDWEKQISKKLGSVAYIFGDTIRSSQDYMSKHINNLTTNLIHQLNLPTRMEMQNLTAAVEILTSDLDRLEQQAKELT
ncbi:SCP2 sterol-binding domain-containing protein [Candidatus Halobeggiatoa sp. HSG11]|nr:SCP2 sterol-binding domain-containing protein [Candidatus Halobeggiatoa sp. HSG11]